MTTSTQPPTLKRRWFQYRLRTLLLVMLGVSAALAWVSHERRRIAERREALLKIGIFFTNKGMHYPVSQPQWRIWLLGDDEPGCANRFDARNEFLADGTKTEVSFANAELESLAGLANLQFILLCGTQITDGGLAHLRGLTQLEYLDLTGTQVSDAGIVHLKALTQLRYLSIYNTQVTNAGRDEIQKALPHCEISHWNSLAPPLP